MSAEIAKQNLRPMLEALAASAPEGLCLFGVPVAEFTAEEALLALPALAHMHNQNWNPDNSGRIVNGDATDQ